MSCPFISPPQFLLLSNIGPPNLFQIALNYPIIPLNYPIIPLGQLQQLRIILTIWAPGQDFGPQIYSRIHVLAVCMPWTPSPVSVQYTLEPKSYHNVQPTPRCHVTACTQCRVTVFTRLLHPQHLGGIRSGLTPHRLPLDNLIEYPEPWLLE